MDNAVSPDQLPPVSSSKTLRSPPPRLAVILQWVGGVTLAVTILIALGVLAPGTQGQGDVTRDPVITVAAIVFFISGFAAISGAIPSILYMRRTGQLPGMGSIRFYGGALFDRLWGVRGVMVSLVPFAFLGAFEILAGVWLWQSLLVGGILAVWLTPFAVVFLIGHGAPFFWIVVPLRVSLVALAWSTLT